MKLTTIENVSGVLATISLPVFTIGILRVCLGGHYRKSGQNLLGVGVLLWVGFFFLNPPHSGSRHYAQATVCKNNLKDLATALEQYAEAHEGSYPNELAELIPTHLKAVPSCVSAEADTYSSGYQRIPAKGERPDFFRLSCSGYHHEKANLGPNLPGYDSEQGLIQR